MKPLLFFACIGLFSTLYAQVKVSGKVTDQKGNPLQGVSIRIIDSYDGSTTDAKGNFFFETLEKSPVRIQASMLAYKTLEVLLYLDSIAVNKEISLKELITELNAVVITAGSFEASDRKKGSVLTRLDILTTASANADVSGAIKTLPGSQLVGESEGLFIRGGTAGESKIFMDGSLVNNFFYSSLPGIATRGRFNAFLFKGTVFNAGGYSALYGQALSAALILESNDLPERTEADLNFSVIGAGTGIQKLAKNKQASWGLTYNYTNLALAFGVIRQKQEFSKFPVYHQGDANFRVKTRSGGIIKYYSYLSWNKVGFKSPDIDSIQLKNAFSLQNINTYHSLNWKENLGNRWKLQTALSYSTNKDDITNGLQDGTNTKITITDPPQYATKNFGIDQRASYAQIKGVLEKGMQEFNALRFGAEHFYSKERSLYTLYTGAQFPEMAKNTITAAFLEADIYISKNLAAKLGTRGEYSNRIGYNLAPRFSLAYKVNRGSQFSFAYGLFYQSPERRYLPAIQNPGFAKAGHYILQFQRQADRRSFRAEIFYKDYQKLYKTAINNTGRELVSGNNGEGYAKGLEFFWRDKRTFKGVDYWVSYSFLDTKRNHLNFPGLMNPNFAAKHTASFVVKKFSLPLKTSINASYSFASGRPYYNLRYNSSEAIYEIKDAGNTIPYNSLAVSLNYLPNIGKANKKAFIVWVFSITNVLAQDQVFGYNYSYDGNRKEAITPPARRFVFLGCFMSFGIDRTQEVINKNL